MSTRWIEVNLPWAIRTSPEMDALNQKFYKSVDDAKKAWRLAYPEIASLEQTNPDDFKDAFEIQDKHEWIRGHLKAENPEQWRDEALARIPEVQEKYQSAFRHLVQHRYAYVKMAKFVNTFPDILQVQDDMAMLKERQHSMQFCNHEACAVGVLIDVRSEENGIVSRSVMLIGDVTPSGLDDGCCSAGLKDDDVIVAYADLRQTIEETLKCLT